MSSEGVSGPLLFILGATHHRVPIEVREKLALSAEAASARDEADTAQRRADELQTQAGQARTRAEIGKQAVASVRGMDRVAQTLSAAVGRLADAAEAGPSQGLGLQESGRIPAPTASSDLYTPAAGVRPALSVQPGQVVDLKV